MGWTSTHRDKGTTNEEFFKFNEGTIVHATATVNNVFYAAIESPSEPGKIFAFVALTQWAPKSYFNFTYKDMDENCGPGAAEAPAKVLDALTETDNEYALEWRAKCRAHLAQRAALKGLKHGDKVTMTRTVSFSNGDTLDTFTVSRHRVAGGGRTKVVLTDGYQGYRFPNWRDQVKSVTRDGVTTLTPVGVRIAAKS